MDNDFAKLWEHVTEQFWGDWTSLHGPSHWRRVERNGLLLASQTGANPEVVKLFALFHDCQRIDDGWDKGHGERGAAYAKHLRGTMFDLTDDDFELLTFACTWHTYGTTHHDPAIATCWDADRLDLNRVGVRPDPARMCTTFGSQIARFGSVDRYLASATKT